MIHSSFKQAQLPRFNQIKPTEINKMMRDHLDQNKQRLATLLAQQEPYTWGNLIQPLEEMNDEFNQIWSPISHLHAVMESEALRQAYNDTLPLITKYHTDLAQNEQLFHAISFIANHMDTLNLTPAQHKIIQNDIRD